MTNLYTECLQQNMQRMIEILDAPGKIKKSIFPTTEFTLSTRCNRVKKDEAENWTTVIRARFKKKESSFIGQLRQAIGEVLSLNEESLDKVINSCEPDLRGAYSLARYVLDKHFAIGKIMHVHSPITKEIRSNIYGKPILSAQADLAVLLDGKNGPGKLLQLHYFGKSQRRSPEALTLLALIGLCNYPNADIVEIIPVRPTEGTEHPPVFELERKNIVIPEHPQYDIIHLTLAWAVCMYEDSLKKRPVCSDCPHTEVCPVLKKKLIKTAKGVISAESDSVDPDQDED